MGGPHFELIKGKTFVNETIKVDGKRFDSCTFRGCVLQFGATAPFEMVGDGHLYDVQWQMVENAGATIHVLRLLNDMGMHDTIQQICDHIQGRGLADQMPQGRRS
jgi:hypothetical protein